MQGFCFVPVATQPHISVHRAFCFVNAELYRTRHKTSYRALQGLFLRSAPIYCLQYQTYISGYNTACTTLERITAPQHLQHIPDTSALLWIHARRCSISHTMPARRGLLLSCVDRWQVLTHCQQYRPGAPAEGQTSPPAQGQPGGLRSDTGQRSGRGGRRGTIGGLSPLLFSGFRPIANRGQQ